MNRISNNNFLKVVASLLFFLTAQVCMASEEVPLLPMTVQGTALVDGIPAPIGTTVAAYLNGEQVGKYQVTTSSGEYCLWISGTVADEGRTLRFAVNGQDTGKILIWKSGKQVLSLQLSVGKGENSEDYVKSLTSIINSKSLTKTEKPTTLGKDSAPSVIDSSVPEPDVNFLKSISASSMGKGTAQYADDSTNLKSALGFTIVCAIAGVIVLIFGLNFIKKRS